MASPETDRRRDKRLDLTLPVKFFRDAEESLSLHDGVTHDVSSGGVYFEAPAGQVAAAGPLSLRVGVRASEGEDKPSLTLVGSGSVCRLEKLESENVVGSWPKAQIEQGMWGVAVQFQQRPTIQLQSLEELLWEDRRH